MAHTGRESPSCNRRSKAKRRKRPGNRVWSGGAGGEPQICQRLGKGEKRKEKRQEKKREEREIARPARPGTCPGATKCKRSLVVLVLPSSVRLSVVCPLQTWCGCGVGRQQHPLADATPPTRPATATAHDALARESVRAKRLGGRRTRQLRSQSSCWRWSVCPGEMETGLSEEKNSGSRAGCDLENVRVPLGSGPRPQIGWLRLLTIPFFGHCESLERERRRPSLQFFGGAENLECFPASTCASCVREAGEERGGHASPTPAAHRQGQGSPCDTPCPPASHSTTNGRKHPQIQHGLFLLCSALATGKECCTDTQGHPTAAFRPSPPRLSLAWVPNICRDADKTCQDPPTREQTAYTVRQYAGQWLQSTSSSSGLA